MIKLEKSASGRDVKVSFVVPADVEALGVAGDFNGWDASRAPFRRRSNGTRSVAVTLPAGVEYEFRYLGRDGWFNDDGAHRFAENAMGSTNCVLCT